MKIITYATHSEGTFDQLTNSGEVTVIGFGEKWEGFIGKAKSILKAGPSVSAPTIPSATKGGGGANNAISDNNQGDQTSQNVIKVVVLDSDITKQQQQTTKVKAVSTIIG